MPMFRSTRKGKKCFLSWASTSVWPQGVTQHRIFIKIFFRFDTDFLAFFAHTSSFKFLEFKEFNKTIIPFALVGYETGYSQLGTTHLVGNLPSHVQRALMEKLLIIIWQALRASSMRQTLCSDWLPERARWSDTARPGLPVSFLQIKFRQSSSECTKVFSRWN